MTKNGGMPMADDKNKTKKWKVPVEEAELTKMGWDPNQHTNKETSNFVRKKLGLAAIVSQRSSTKTDVIDMLRDKGIKVDDGLSTGKLLKLAAEVMSKEK